MAVTELSSPVAPGAPRVRSDPRRDDRSARASASVARWRHAALLLGASAAALASLHSVLQGISWWVVGVGFAALVLVAATLARTLLRRAFWAPIISLCVGILLLTAGYAADTALLGVIPTLSTPGRFAAVVESGLQSVVEQRVPATPELGIVFLIAVLMIACAWFAELAVASRVPALVVVPLASILAIPMAVKPGLTDAFWFLVTAGIFLAVLRIGRRPDSKRVTLLVGVVVVVGSLLLPNAFPVVADDPGPTRSGIRTGLNPLVNLGDDLRRGDPVLAATYTTTATTPVYLRLTTLDDFNGDIWGPTPRDTFGGDDLGAFPVPSGLGDQVPRTPATVEVSVADIISRWLPVPYPTARIDGLVGDWTWGIDDLTVSSSNSGARGQDYTAEFLEVNPSQEQLARTRPQPPGAFATALDLPEQMPEIIAQTAHEVADSEESSYDQALALQRYLRSAPFAYSEDTPVSEGFDGSGVDALAVFLDRKTGYCVHYASAMAVMARVLGIPSRVAVGFQPGDREFDEGRSIYTVTSSDMHAWPELYFDGIGWLRFEPTPSRGVVPRYGTTPVDDPNTPEDESAPTPAPTSTAAPGQQLGRDDIDPGLVADSAEQGPALAISLAVLAGVLAMLLVPAGFRVGVRRRRFQRIRTAQDPANAAWAELRDTARDHGWSAPETETPRAFAERLQTLLVGAGDDEAIAAARDGVEASAFARPDAPGVTVAEVAAARRAIAHSQDARVRLRAFLLPPSLVARFRPPDD